MMELSLNMTEDENCAFITTNLLDQTDNFDDWLDKNGVQYIFTSDCLNDNIVDKQLGPLLNQLDPSDTFDTLSDNDSILFDDNNKITTNTIKSKMGETETNSKCSSSDVSITFETLVCKCLYFEAMLPGGINIEFKVLDDKINLHFTNNQSKNIFTHVYISDTAGHITIPKEPVQVTSVEKITIANDLKAYIPCLLLTTGLRLYVCPQSDCPLVFTKLGAAKLHTLVQIGHKPFKCTYPNCTWAFYNSFKLRRHQESHTNNKDFVCYVNNCGRKFSNIYNLNIHIKNHGRPATLPCPVENCSLKFQTLRLRVKHLKTHDISEAPFQCPQANCNRAFFLETGLTSHARTHLHKDSELRCDYPNCGKIFEQPCRLKEHSRTHTGQRPYSCTYDQCKWSFTTASKLKRHQSTHTKERKFHCTIGTCNKSFLRSEHLKEHTLTHIGSRSFNCEVCSASFFGKSSLYMHIKKAHPEQNQACARALPYAQAQEKPTAEMLLEQAIQSLGVPSDIILGGGLLADEPLALLENENFSTVNLRDLD